MNKTHLLLEMRYLTLDSLHVRNDQTVTRNFIGSLLFFLLCVTAVSAQEVPTAFYIREYRVSGSKLLSKAEIGRAVYPFLGPQRSVNDVEQARAVLEKFYHDKGFQTISVSVPRQDPRHGVIRLEVLEGKVDRLRIKGAKWFLPSRIRSEVPSIAEGNVPDFLQVNKEIVALNRNASRRVTPSLRAGVAPGTVDIDLTVEDKLPLQGSLELNNRNSPDTTSLRLNGSLSYGNLFQLGHTIGGSFQIAPQRLDDAQVYSGYYLARISEGTSLMLTVAKQNSDVNTIGGAASTGRGEIIGFRALHDLPNTDTFYQNFSFGIDYKNLSENLVIGKDVISSPIEYYPLSASYGATWMGKKGFTEMNHTLTFGLRGLGSGQTDYSNRRFNADGNFVILRGDAAHTHDLKGGAQVFGKLQGQVASRPLVNSEQFSGGGLGTARGYLESTSLGDNGVFFTAELRSPSLTGNPKPGDTAADEWRFHVFTDAGLLGIWDALPGQQQRFGFASAGFGTRFKVANHYNGSLDVATPFLEKQPTADQGDIRITFRSWADF